jgi:hypothetical protein
VIREWKRVHVARVAPNLIEKLLALQHRTFRGRIVGNNLPGNRKDCLKKRSGCDIGYGKLVRRAVAIGVGIQPEAFLGLHPVVLVHRVVRELAKGDHVAALGEWSNRKSWRAVWAAADEAQRADALNVGGVPCAVRIAVNRSEVDSF